VRSITRPRVVSSREAFSLPLSLSLALLLSGCSGGAQERLGRVRSLAEIRHQTVVIQQWDASCGAAALATLLTFDLDDPVSERAVASAMLHRTNPIRVRTRGGFSLLDMQVYAESRGYGADGFADMSLMDLAEMLPAVVPVQFHGYDHFVVVRQIHDDLVLFADPAYGKRTMSPTSFDRAWKQKVAFVVTRPAAGP